MTSNTSPREESRDDTRSPDTRLATQTLLANNREWASRKERDCPGFFKQLSKQQKPSFMWIGCSDSRVPANQITGLAPGEVFVHRNVANVVVHSDLNALSTVQFAVEQLQVRHIMVVGHFGCGGVQAALEGARVGLVDNWLRHVQDVRDMHQEFLGSLPKSKRHDALCALNVIQQAYNVARSTVLRDAWERNQVISVHGWVYGLNDGLLQDLRIDLSNTHPLEYVYNSALKKLKAQFASEACLDAPPQTS
jgi:carbonic anhydrase